MKYENFKFNISRKINKKRFKGLTKFRLTINFILNLLIHLFYISSSLEIHTPYLNKILYLSQ
jgi:hypothetical protein